jgi:PAS domain S-box-containing protein
MGKFNTELRVQAFSRSLRLHSPLLRHAIAALSTLPALGLWLSTLPLSRQIPYLPFFFSVLFSAWFLGHGPGLTATAVSAVLVEIFIFRPAGLQPGTGIFLHVAFLAAGITMSIMAAAKKTAEQNLRDLTETLETRVAERTQRLEQEIEKQKQAEALLSRQATLLQLTHDAIIVRAYEDATIQFWNRGAAETYGWNEQEALGKRLPELLKTQYAEALPEIEQKVLRSGHWDGELIHTRKDGRKVVLSSRWSLIKDSEGKPQGIIQLNYDITEKYRAEQKARHNERLAALGTAAAVFAHEIANPLNGIASSLQILELELAETQALSPSIAEPLRISMEEIQRLTRLLNDFRTLSRPRALTRTPASLPQIIDDVLSAEEANFNSAGITVQRDYQQTAPVRVDGEKLKQVFLNLLKNAAEAMPNGGVVAIRCYQSASSLIIEIGDTGMGIPDNLDVFQLFTTTKSSGTGMGLPVVREILTAHRAQITFTSEAGKGTRFIIDFPLTESSAGPAQSEDQPS